MDPKWCYKFPYELLDGVNIALSKTNSYLVFWNKFQIFLVDKQDFERNAQQPNCLLKYFTDFEIHKLILAEQLLCLDNEGNLRAYALDLQPNASVHKKPKLTFQMLKNNILCMQWYENLLFTIKSEEGELILQSDKIISTSNVLVKSCNKITIKNLQLSEVKRDNCMMCIYKINKADFEVINQLFRKTVNLKNEYNMIIIITFDKLTLYGLLVDSISKSDVLNPVKLLTYPSEVNSVTIVRESDLNLIIGLNSGTVIKQSLNIHSKTPNIAHFNTAIHRFIVLDDKVIYTDGITMWISKNTFSEHDPELRQLFVKNVKDFTAIENNGKIICTTYSKLVYVFNVTNETSYLVPVADSEYYSAEHLFNNMKYLNRITEEIEKNDEIVKNIKNEETYITTLALSNRQDIMNEIIQCCVSVYEKYEDILREGLELLMTNNLRDYFLSGSFYILIKMTVNLQQNYDNILANIFTDSNILISIFLEERIIKTISIKIVEQLKILNIVVPLIIHSTNKLSEVIIDIKIIKKIPKVINCKQNVWAAVYYKQIIVTPEHFIETNFRDNVKVLKDTEDSIHKSLYIAAHKYHGHLFRITKVSDDILTMSFYIKLPNNYREFLQNEMVFKEHFNNSTKAKFLLKELSSEEFLISKKKILFLIFNEEVYVEMVNHGFSNDSGKMIKVICKNPLLGLGIRNFFSNLFHKKLSGDTVHKFLSCASIHSTLEKIENAVKEIITNKLPFEDFLKLYEQFQISLCETLV